MDALFLARLQFALTIGFHFIFPPISIGLAWQLVIMEGIGWKKKDEMYIRMSKFFAKLLALTFALGVATGIVMEFQFGTNWSVYSEFVGDIFGAPLAAEGIFAFFLESGFLGLYLFGRNKVSKAVHWFSILMVAVGATISAFWIIAANSWQQTPAGYIIRNNRAELTSFYDAVINPSTMIRYLHTVDAALITGAFFAAGVSAYLIIKNKEVELAKRSMKIAIIFGLAASLLELVPLGDTHARQVARTQPEKFASIEGIQKTQSNAPLVLFGIPNNKTRELSMRVEIPGLLSWLVHGNADTPVKGFNEFESGNLPPFALTFISFHIMAALGTFFILFMLIALIQLFRNRLWDNKWLLRTMIWSIPLPIAACELGWITAEVGRQPWIVYGLLKTSEAYSTSVTAGEVLFSIIIFSFIYLLLGILYIYILVREVKHGPQSINT
ncbi:MAG: cytochrome ubiquinol oxidase subunit I [Bacteroidetes bacterium]|nr:cytochrome ubiquinol oxidase subunit I [Bacteroidota bacterium]